MSTIKVTPEQLHYVSNQVDQARQQLEHLQDNLSRQIMFLQAMWMGVTQERFYDDFERSRPVLQKALESMVYTSKELKDIATRFENADAEKGSLGSVIGAVGAAAMMKSSVSDTGSEDKGYRMAQVNIYGRLMWMPVNENGVPDQASLQAYEKDQGHLDINKMQAAGHVEEPGEDINALQIKAFENRIHPFTGEPVSDKYAQMMLTSLKFSQIFMAFQMVRGSIPGRKGPFRLPASDPAVAKIKKNLEAGEARKGSNIKGTDKIGDIPPAFKQKEFASSYEARLSQTPAPENRKVSFEGTRGESKCILKPPPDPEIKKVLDEAGIDGIQYKNAVPDYSPVAKAQVEIEYMLGGKGTYGGKARSYNFAQSDQKLADQLNNSPELARQFGMEHGGITARDIEKYRDKNKLTWHELNDVNTMQLVPTKVNSTFGHLGGVGEVNAGAFEPGGFAKK